MELAQEVHRLEALREVGGEVGQQTRLRRRQVEDHRLRIGRIDRHALAGHRQIVLRFLDDVRVEVQIVIPELHVRAGERRAVRPLVALAQEEGQLGEIVVPLPALGDVRHDGLQIVRVAHEVDVPDRQEVRGAGLGGIRQHIELPAILADRVVRHHDQRLFRNPLGQRRQVRVALDLGIQRRAIRIPLEAQRAVRSRFELGKLILLREGAGGDSHHVRDGDRRALGRIGRGTEHAGRDGGKE